MIQRCKLTVSWWATYKSQIAAVVTAFEGLDLVNLANTWHAQVHDEVVADTKREFNLAYHESQTMTLYTWLADRPGVVRQQLTSP